MRKDVLVYISGPIAPANGYTVEQNIQRGLEVFMGLSELGIPSFLPHMNAAHPITSRIDYDKWLEYDCRIIDRCTHVYMMPDWALSKGAIMEYNYALSIKKSIALYFAQLMDMLNDHKSARRSRR